MDFFFFFWSDLKWHVGGLGIHFFFFTPTSSFTTSCLKKHAEIADTYSHALSTSTCLGVVNCCEARSHAPPSLLVPNRLLHITQFDPSFSTTTRPSNSFSFCFIIVFQIPIPIPMFLLQSASLNLTHVISNSQKLN